MADRYTSYRRAASALGLLVTMSVLAHPAVGGGAGEIVLAPTFETAYEVVDLGWPIGVPEPGGGIAFAFDDPDTLLVGGAATSARGVIFSVDLVRETCGCITAFDGPATHFADAPFIDGGLDVAPGGVLLYTSYDTNALSQILPGSTSADRVIDLGALGVAPSTGTLGIVPPGLPGAGTLKIASYDASAWYRAALAPDGAGTFDVVSLSPLADMIGPGPEGIAYVPGGWPGLPDDAVFVTKWDANRVDVYTIDDQGDPILATEQPFIASLFGAEGAAVDPLTGEVLFSTLGVVTRVVVVRPVDPCPADIAMPDGTVDFNDVLALIDQWGLSCVDADLDRNGDVGFNDVLLLILSWGPCG